MYISAFVKWRVFMKVFLTLALASSGLVLAAEPVSAPQERQTFASESEEITSSRPVENNLVCEKAVSFSNHKNYATLSVGKSVIILEKHGHYISSKVDFLVNPAQPKLTGGGGLDKVIHKAAGPGLKKACLQIPEVRKGVRCPTGEARLTYGARLPQGYVVHTVGPKVSGKVSNYDKRKLWDCYHNSLVLVEQFCNFLENPNAPHPAWMDKVHSSKEQALKQKLSSGGVPSIAFCSISTGSYGYPKDQGPKVAFHAMFDFAKHHSGIKIHFIGGDKENASFLKEMKKAK